MKHHNGKIGVKSSGISGEGSLFYIEIPAILVGTRAATELDSNRFFTSNLESKVSESIRDSFDIVQSFDEIERNLSSSRQIMKTNYDENEILSNISTPYSTTNQFFDETIVTNLTSRKLFQRALVVDDSKLNRKMLIAAVDQFFDLIDQVYFFFLLSLSLIIFVS